MLWVEELHGLPLDRPLVAHAHDSVCSHAGGRPDRAGDARDVPRVPRARGAGGAGPRGGDRLVQRLRLGDHVGTELVPAGGVRPRDSGA